MTMPITFIHLCIRTYIFWSPAVSVCRHSTSVDSEAVGGHFAFGKNFFSDAR